MDTAAGEPTQADSGPVDAEVPTGNPLGEHLDLSLSVPTIEVRMVNAAALEEYEIWLFASSILGGAVVGFLVAYIQSFNSRGDDGESTFLIVTILLAVLLALGLWRVLLLRRRIASESRTYRLKALASPEPPKEKNAS